MTFDPKKRLMNMRGNGYLEVKWRIVWFRDVHPGGNIAVELLSTEPLIMKATVYDGDGNALASGHGSADSSGKKVVWSGREIEKAETAAIGRALAHAGFGTQFTDEVEGEHLADAPVERSGGNATVTNFSGANTESVQQQEPQNQLDIDWKKFWPYVKDELNLTREQVHDAIGCKSVKDWTGTKEKLFEQLKDYASRANALPKNRTRDDDTPPAPLQRTRDDDSKHPLDGEMVTLTSVKYDPFPKGSPRWQANCYFDEQKVVVWIMPEDERFLIDVCGVDPLPRKPGEMPPMACEVILGHDKQHGLRVDGAYDGETYVTVNEYREKLHKGVA